MRRFLLLIATLVHKEFLSIIKDPRRRMILVVPVLVQSLLFGYVATFDLNSVDCAVVDLDHTALSREFIARFSLSPTFSVKLQPASQAGLARLIDTKEIRVGLVVPKGFERDIRSGAGTSVQVLVDGRNSNVAGAASGYASQIAADFAAGLTGRASPVTLRAWFNPNLESRWNIVSGLLAILSTIQVVILSALSVATEREQGTFSQLLVTPASPAQILIGKAVPPVLIGVALSCAILLIAVFWFRIPLQGRTVDIIAALFIYNVSIVGIGLSLSALCQTIQQAMLSGFCMLVPCVLLSGFSTPVSSMPPALQAATLANPVRWSVEMMQRIFLEGSALPDLAQPLAILAAIAVVNLAAAAWLFGRRVA